MSNFYCSPCGAYAPEDCAHENQLKVIVDLTAERDRYRAALNEIGSWDFGGWAPSPDEALMVKRASAALGRDDA